MEARPRLLVEAFERYAGEEEKGLREGYHVLMKSPGGWYGNGDLPPFEELERRLKEGRGGTDQRDPNSRSTITSPGTGQDNEQAGRGKNESTTRL